MTDATTPEQAAPAPPAWPDGTTATPSHVALTVRPDGSINPSVGVAFNMVTAAGRDLGRFDEEVKVEVEEDAATLHRILSDAFHRAIARHGVIVLTPQQAVASSPAPDAAVTPPAAE